MANAEKIELALILVIGISIWEAGTVLPTSVSVVTLFLEVSVLLLLQSLIRDLWPLMKQKRAMPPSSCRQARCLCVESTIGATGVTVGIMVFGTGIDRSVPMDGWNWALLAFVVMAIGFAIKDYVLEWKPFRLHRDKDHINTVFTWKG